VLVTMIQLGSVVGVATLGTLFLSQVSYPASASTSGHALATTAAGVGVLMLIGAVLAGRRRDK
jgi:hypothetical protein